MDVRGPQRHAVRVPPRNTTNIQVTVPRRGTHVSRVSTSGNAVTISKSKLTHTPFETSTSVHSTVTTHKHATTASRKPNGGSRAAVSSATLLSTAASRPSINHSRVHTPSLDSNRINDVAVSSKHTDHSPTITLADALVWQQQTSDTPLQTKSTMQMQSSASSAPIRDRTYIVYKGVNSINVPEYIYTRDETDDASQISGASKLSWTSSQSRHSNVSNNSYSSASSYDSAVSGHTALSRTSQSTIHSNNSESNVDVAHSDVSATNTVYVSNNSNGANARKSNETAHYNVPSLISPRTIGAFVDSEAIHDSTLPDDPFEWLNSCMQDPMSEDANYAFLHEPAPLTMPDIEYDYLAQSSLPSSPSASRLQLVARDAHIEPTPTSSLSNVHNAYTFLRFAQYRTHWLNVQRFNVIARRWTRLKALLDNDAHPIFANSDAIEQWWMRIHALLMRMHAMLNHTEAHVSLSTSLSTWMHELVSIMNTDDIYHGSSCIMQNTSPSANFDIMDTTTTSCFKCLLIHMATQLYDCEHKDVRVFLFEPSTDTINVDLTQFTLYLEWLVYAFEKRCGHATNELFESGSDLERH